jgi:hypothetical protein
MMTKKVISTVQEYLTVVSDNKCYQIVNVELLLRRHPPEAVIAFLEQLRTEYKKELGQLIRANKTDEKINVLVAKNWRIKMAVITIKNANNVQDAA